MVLQFQESDPFAPVHYVYDVDEIICSRRTQFQQLLIFRNSHFGRILALDGVVQLTERDEYFYHEMLVHVPLHAHPGPAEVLIIGGGDGGSLREVLKNEGVKKVQIVELDGGVIEAAKEFLPTLSTGFSDPRVHVRAARGEEYLADTGDKYDVIIMDSTDPVGPAAGLFSDATLADIAAALKPGGVFAAQTESLHFHLGFVRDVQRKLERLFKFADIYTVPLATYGGNWWTFSIGSLAHDPRRPLRPCREATRYYGEDVHCQAFLAPSLKSRLIDAPDQGA